jgi:uncharacterized protein
MELSIKDRLFLANQFLILEKLCPNDAEYYAHKRKALERGYALEYGRVAEDIDREGLSEDQCRLVRDVLDMHRALGLSYNALEDKSGINESDIRFFGFDGNNEIAYMAYANYLIHDLGLWEEQKDVDLNSPVPTLQRYQRMLDKWRRFDRKLELSKDEIIAVRGVSGTSEPGFGRWYDEL